MAIDSRVLRVLKRLDEKGCPSLACDLFTIHDASPDVVSSALRSGRTIGLCDFDDAHPNWKSSTKYWFLTEAGKAAIKEPAN